ncbi:hypothetical protein Pst134EA_003199 [Puccinia striiformis f. sp. tritici]|uniref:ferric-chelate reductase (NADPH) n=1 Tax=Puccinia striiformis f. sp. tritici PST-78 TaxID=1165861 RepID=A0A0L0W524_9BASI|nr:hypothetical protein Pst134EA_003199 [Puccinia striiformis f. sp. tritici]KAH9464760.1 hypothetical protein Pst134EB_004273 [Puccinia striiformis f. sp. tritici]KAH9472592.1 hypothetical protein Pst134EA_003199 [Puccinia striiformis f. sp. tritici]KNF06628.1 hypothetical protein PSTG_00502 [Puccinia striiformis f. sp. tritici PST-78]
MSSSNLTGIYGGSDDPCILGYTNGTYPNGTLGKGNWRRYGVYMPSAAEKAACQAPNDPWVWTQYYGWWTTYFIMVGVVAVSLVNGIKRLHNLNRIMGLPSIIYHHPKVSALFRMGSYPALKFLRVELPPLGPAIFLFGFLTYSTLVCFLRRPFYRPPHYGGSPLGIRAEWVATAMVPWLYATATKRNFLVYFTGVSFKRIMDFHKWAPWICLYMSILHTWTMIIRIERQQPWHYTITHNKLYWNGFPPLLALGWLCVMSLGPIRARFYESFFIFHMVAAFIFLVWMYIHLENVLDSWQYMHAATVLWAAGILWRLVAYTLDHGWFSRVPRATIEALPANAVRLRIPVPSSRQWSAGSYVYLRFPSIKPWESHPFTISTLPTPSHNGTEGNEMVFVLRPRQGLTARLKTLADMPTLPAIRACLIDGPYGGFMDSLRACDTVLLVAGGTGMAALISIAQSLQRSGPARGMSCCTALEIHWAIRDSVCLEWFRKQLSEIESVKIYVTNETQPLQSDQNTAEIKEQEKEQVEIEEQEQGNVGIEEQEKKTSLTPTLRSRTHYNRPNLPEVIGAAAGRYAGRIGVMVCGPTSMVTEVRSTVAQLQKSILLSKKNVKCNELELYQESFDD